MPNNASANNIVREIHRPLISGYHDKLLQQIVLFHIINLIVMSSEKTVDKNIERIRECIRSLKDSNNVLQFLEDNIGSIACGR